MATLTAKTALVTGASRGLGRAIALALAGAGAKVVAVARDEARLAALRDEAAGAVVIARADVSEESAADELLARFRPDVVVLAAGATPHMAPIQEQTWAQVTAVWDTDVKQTFCFGRAALTLPLAPGSRVLVVSSGAGIAGSPLSGGYAGAKRMQWFLTNYFAAASRELGLDVRFQALLPKQIIPGTELGRAASMGYAEQLGIDQAKFLERFGTPLMPERVGEQALAIVTGAALDDATAIAITGETLASLDG